MKSSFSKFVIFLEFILVAYLVYALTKNVYQNYKVDQIIEAYKADNESIENQIKSKTDEYLYVTSEEYIDKIAKQNLGYINPGEEVIVLSNEVLSETLSNDMKIDSSYEVPIRTQWKNVFFAD